ncbi:YqeG family HAD IIIA-type phosphatase [Pseudogracilibacillus auburnensis]|uniref:YqeG family HAD IIIA-type phosphatase n=1 Tax=Pseudogracilibacillus auburnensis TaxID=1494959 RepID=UPI001A9749C4|nr:YqeG family HAD IIIA-type phosphatase [Pseudogracilibacillus auburnensis]MBO1003450.1 YqeG family HAD IIIA-type phosphatase [Pseudogracilibacillus auburnensis]
MLNLFLPNKHVKSIFDIEPTFLQAEGKKGIIIDLDNTLVPWNVSHATDEVITWLKKMDDANIKVTIFSNNNEERVTVFAEPLGTSFIYQARKPLQRAFKRAKIQMELETDEIVVIGDQLLTDILGGNKAGFYTILVVPIVQSDAPITKFNRNVERLILNYFYRKGKLTRRMTDGE